MTNKFISYVDGNRQGVASDSSPRLHRVDSVSILSRQSLLPILLLCLTLFIGVGQMWGAATEKQAVWAFTSSSYPSNNSDFAATSGAYKTNSNFKITNTSTGWNTNKDKFKFTTSSNAANFLVSVKVADAIPSGTKVTLKMKLWYNKASNAPLTSAGIKVSTNGTSYSITGVGTTTWNLGTSETEYSCVYTTQNNLTANTTIYFQLTGSGRAGQGEGYCSSASITVPVESTPSCTAPTISAHPSNATYSVGDTPSNLSVTASGTSLTYQWYSNTTATNAGGTSIPSATNSTYSPSTASNGTFYYYCVVSSSSCTTTSNVATITVNKVAATVTLNNYSGDATTTGLFVGDNFTLPSTNNYTCGTKTFVGWSTVEFAETNTKPTSNYYAKGAKVTLGASQIFYAVFATASAGAAPSAYSAGDEGTFVLAAYVSNKWYALPTNPTVSNGKIAGEEITVSTTATSVNYVTSTNASGYEWTIADATNGQTISDGSKYIYHSNGGSSGTNLTYGTGTTYTWTIAPEANGLTFKGTNGSAVNSRGLLASGTTFGGYALSNEDASGYYRIHVLPIGGGTTYSAYSTTCCTPLGSINGSFLRYHFLDHFGPFGTNQQISVYFS